jgi:hypothetical protein
MSEEKIQLPEFLIAELYKGSLVDLETFTLKTLSTEIEEGAPNEAEKSRSIKKIRYLGENQKRVTIIVNEPEVVFLSEEDLTFLTNILKACQLTLGDIAIVNTAKQEINYEIIKEQLTPSTILLFDVEPSAVKLPFMIPAFQVQTFDSCTIMLAPALPLINATNNDGKLLKTKLWVSLKKIFSIG